MPTVAIVGASSDRRKFGNKAVRAYISAGYQVFPVNLRESQIEGLPVFRTVADIPLDHIDRVAFYLPPAQARDALKTLAGKSIGMLILNPGSDDPVVIAQAKELNLPVVTGCAIIAAGVRPEQFPDE
jgi:predicted CoA-binding protein